MRMTSLCRRMTNATVSLWRAPVSLISSSSFLPRPSTGSSMIRRIIPGDHNTGLITGYVRIDRTFSFTSLSVLAHDNSYQIVFLLAETTSDLVEQSFECLKKDLEIEKNRNWKLFSTRDKGIQGAEVEQIKSEPAK